MNKIVLLLFVTVLAACDPPEPIATEKVESLASNSERFKELRQQCKLERVKLGDELCNRVAEATRQRFYGDGKVPYTPPESPPKF
ncbi:entry exclusion lipoprotein TrbK [Paenalcaligenes niemegkensis]|uniref:entry exclusion lipoprotein TrbK n=1 Tax=Paenalcaligenes niemegkensis TaxID=2895469 RepID=UPI001EE8CA98|nr:entry exclusion lipoprotein TrbK [Paenalcaligenes niemegkensis]MCQ9617941.1 entry exclusion lipoprotein TrbK [Paenalcaligenes niemegkensis]